MGKLLVFILAIISILSCKEDDCLSNSLLAFEDLSESNVNYYIYNYDTLFLEIPSVVTPNNDSLNDVFTIRTNILESNFVAVDFKLQNNCGETLYKQHGTFPFVIKDLESMKDGGYNFDFSIVLNDKRLISGGGVLNVVRK